MMKQKTENNNLTDYSNDFIYEAIKNEKDISCQAFLVDGKCPKSRYLSKDCPLGHENCVVSKE